MLQPSCKHAVWIESRYPLTSSCATIDRVFLLSLVGWPVFIQHKHLQVAPGSTRSLAPAIFIPQFSFFHCLLLFSLLSLESAVRSQRERWLLARAHRQGGGYDAVVANYLIMRCKVLARLDGLRMHNASLVEGNQACVTTVFPLRTVTVVRFPR